MLRQFAPVVAVMIGSACASLAGLDAYGPGATGGGGEGVGAGQEGGGEAGGGEEGGAGPTGCPPDAPGWQGPAAVYMGSDEAPPCTGPWPVAEDGGIEPTLDGCNCTCSIVADTQTQAGLCGNALWNVTWSSNNDCNMGVVGPSLMIDVCNQDATMPTDLESVMVAPTAPPMVGICEEDPTNGFAGPPGYATHVRVCAFAGPTDASALCEREVPAGYPTRLCVFRTGDVEEPCPSGYDDRHVIVTSFDDQSDCGCTCTENGVTRQATLEFHDNASCQGGSLGMAVADGTCQNVQNPGTLPYFEVRSAQASGQCGGIPNVTKDLPVQSEVTVCCEP